MRSLFYIGAWCCCVLLCVGLLAYQTAPQPSYAETRAQQVPMCLIPCRVLGEPHDADTFKADVLFPWKVTLRDQTVRTDYDAWEVTRTRRSVNVTDAEIAKGKRARAAFIDLLARAQAVYLSPTDRDSGMYDRISASVWLQMPAGELLDVHAFMRAGGHLRSASTRR